MLKLVTLFLMLLVVLVFSSCLSVVGPNPPAFQRGIRFWSFYDVVDNPPSIPIHLMSIPPGAVIISGILNQGTIGFEQGPASGQSGNDRDFIGETDKFGLSDHLQARDNANWTISAEYTFVLRACGFNQSTFRIPQGGGQVFAVCYIKG
jgi:hypothetical protein